MVVLLAKLKIKEGEVHGFEALMRDNVVPEVRKEPGNQVYNFCKSKEDPRVLMIYEEYDDDNAYEAHRKHLDELGMDFGPLLDAIPELDFYDKIAE